MSATKQELYARIKALQAALYFWLPCMPDPADEGPRISQDCENRIAKDAQLLMGLKESDLDTAESFGWIELRGDQPEGNAAMNPTKI